MTTMLVQLTDLLTTKLRENGWVHLRDQSKEKLNSILEQLGEVIFTTDVVVKPESKSMVTSTRGLNFHSDHPKANYIVWFCYKQTDSGGHSILMDAEQAFLKLSSADKKALEKVQLKEHKIFADDRDFYPLVENIAGKRKFYFSFWLANESDLNKQAFLNFHEAVKNSEYVELTLRENDILIVDNDRILHGRTPITGSQDRHLRRFWVSSDIFNKQLRSIPMTTSTFTLPEPITPERISLLTGKGIDPDIASINLEMIKMKLCEPKEGIGWTPDQVQDAEIEYKRYLHLTRHFPYPTYSIVPNKIMDTMWHYHILDTKAYHTDCERVFGHYLHHYPYFGLRGKEDEKNLRMQFGNTKEYYLQTFGENMARNKEADCWHDCEDRCWHACSSDK